MRRGHCRFSIANFRFSICSPFPSALAAGLALLLAMGGQASAGQAQPAPPKAGPPAPPLPSKEKEKQPKKAEEPPKEGTKGEGRGTGPGIENGKLPIDNFQLLLRQVQADPGGATEEQVKELIATGRRLGHCYAVSLAVKAHLAQNYRPTPALLQMAAENALLAGDFRSAAARYKALLTALEGTGGEGRGTRENQNPRALDPRTSGLAPSFASEAAGTLYQVLVDFLGTDDEAYRLMSANCERLRGSAAARRFDAWFLDQARRRSDWPAMARMLQTLLAQQLPLEQERLYFGEHLDQLMEAAVRGCDDRFDALPLLRKIVPAVRDDRRRTLKYTLCLANLEFKAASAGKDKAALDKAYEPVVAAARAYLSGYPTPATLKDVIHAFTDGGAGDDFNEAAWQRQHEAKSAFFVEAFEKLGDAGREAILESLGKSPSGGHIAGLLATREQWAGLATRHADLFRRYGATLLRTPFLTQAPTREAIKQQASVLRDVASRDAAVINALAAGEGEAPAEPSSFAKAIEHLVRRESWHLGYQEPFELIEGELWPAWRRLNTQAGKPPSEATYRLALARFTSDVLAKTPMALDPRAARACVEAAWEVGDAAVGKDPNSKASLAATLGALEWVPYTPKDRREIFTDVRRRFREWANSVRKDSKAPQDLASQIAPLEEALRRAVDSGADVSKAPNALCRALAEAIAAEGKKDQGDFLKAARTLYPLLRDCDAKREPFGRETLLYITRCRLDAFETLDFQAEALADQLGLRSSQLAGKDASSARILREVAEACVFVAPDRGWWRVPKAYQDRTRRLGALFEKALADQLSRPPYGGFSPLLFDWFRATRAGEGWADRESGEAVMAKIIEQKALPPDYRAHESVRSTTCSTMWLIRNEFPRLNTKYPVERHFDGLFVEEANRTGLFDWRYWDFGLDGQKKVANAAAAFLGKLDTLPLGYGDATAPAWSAADLWNWYARALAADKPLRDAMLAKAEGAWGKTRFDTYAMGRGYFAVLPDLSTPDGRKEFFARLGAYLDKAALAPARLGPPFLGSLEKLSKTTPLTPAELDVLLSIFPRCTPDSWPQRGGCEALASLIIQGATAQKRQADLYPLIPHFWKIARDTRNVQFQHDLTKVAVGLGEAEANQSADGRKQSAVKAGTEKNTPADWPLPPADCSSDLALIWSQTGLDLMQADLPQEAANSLVAVQSKSLSNAGGVIPVRREDRRYPVYVAQAAFLAGRFQSAWALSGEHPALVNSMVKELDPSFTIWLIDRHSEVGDFAAAEELARVMIQWFDSVTEGFQPEVRARLLLAYANIAFARKEYPRARALYERIAAAKEFEGTRAQSDAQIQVAEVDRATRRYDQAIQLLEKLARSRDPTAQAESYYHLALVKFDQEEYRDALEDLEAVFARVPDHSNAKILEGRTNVKMRKLEVATEIQVGTVTQRRFVVAGKPLRVNLEDRNLALVGGAGHIELRAWTDSGDEELFSLMPLGDSKTKFRGQIPTALAPAAKHNGALEVLGNDTVHYDFSDAFKKEHKIALGQPQALAVATDAELLVSSGKILTKEEREARALEALIKQRLDALAPKAAEGAAKATVALSTVRPENQIKPGNKFNIRVIDPDQSTTAGRDKVTVRIAASSGDIIEAFPLEETDGYSGVFEGAIETVPGQAAAFASDSEDGKEPNFAISKGTYPPWVGFPDNVRPKSFTIDLNDNVALGKMQIVANVPGRKLKSFTLQTSLFANSALSRSRDSWGIGGGFQTVASWPEELKPWDGSPTMELVRFGQMNRAPASLTELAEYLDEGWLRDGLPKFTLGVHGLMAKWNERVGGYAERMQLAAEKEGSWFLAHLKGAFYQPMRKVRTFQLTTVPEKPVGASYWMTLDDQPGESPTRVRASAGKGVHHIDIYVAATRKANAEFQLECDTDAPPFMAPAPPEMFDVRSHPEIKSGVATKPAAVAASADSTTFDVAFPEGSRARVVRLQLMDFESDAPAIARISLTDAAGKTVLPTREDFMALRKNQVLEMVSGDKITVTYQDPKVITEGREQHEAFLSATFSNATLSACFVEYTEDGKGGRKARYIPMQRFKPGDSIQVFISDPDCDTGDKQDVVAFTARTPGGKPAELKALETEDHSGVFVGTVFPVKKGESVKESESESVKKEKATGKGDARTLPRSHASTVEVAEGDDLVLAYLDRENTDPGIPWERTAVVEQSWFEPPVVRVFEVTSAPLGGSEIENGKLPIVNSQLPRGPAPRPSPPRPPKAAAPASEGSEAEEVVPVTRSMTASWPERSSPDPAKPATLLLGGPLLVEVLFPYAAQSSESTVALYAQTSRGLRAYGKPPEGPFDLRVPGTIRLVSQPSNAPSVLGPPPGYKSVLVRENPYAGKPLDDGRFTFLVPVELAKLPEGSLANDEPDEKSPPVLSVDGTDEILLGVEFSPPGPDGKTQWVTRRVLLAADPFFDITERRGREPLEGVQVGETAYFRVMDPLRDASDENDTVSLSVKTASGTTQGQAKVTEGIAAISSITLSETFTHSGVFKGMAKIVYKGDAEEAKAPDALAVDYGDKITVAYQRPQEPVGRPQEAVGRKQDEPKDKSGAPVSSLPTAGRRLPTAPIERSLLVFKGGDGRILPFTKRFADPAVAVKTQFAMAEAYFELAKRHRELGQEKMAADEIAQGKKILEEAIQDFPDTEARAQADYLLADLALESATETKDGETKKKLLVQAVSSFTDIVATYPDSPYAPRAQYKKALAFEKMGQIDQACEEYVKLSYRYPDNELVAETIARLGQYFRSKGKDLMANVTPETTPVEREKTELQAREMYKTAAQVFGRLAVRFPTHKLAGKTSVLSAHCYMQAQDLPKAIELFKEIIGNAKMENDLVAESMYWCGDCYMKQRDFVNSYRVFKRLTWDYPAGKWAKFARGRLTEDALANVGEKADE